MIVRLPQRRVILGLLGIPFALFGVGNLLANDQMDFDPSIAFISRELLSWIWIVVGAYAIFAMFGSSSRRIIEEIAYGLLFIPPFVWMAVGFISLLHSGSFFIFREFLISATLVVLILYLARHMKNG